MADAWRPTSDLERRLQDSVRNGDQEGYFRLLADSELVVPVPPGAVDDLLANTSHPSWPTQEEDGRVHVLVYTSPAAMHACLGPSYRHFMTLRFRDLAEAWPDARWWLAVDTPARDARAAPLPIEARMPAWFVRQVADGDGRPPQVGRPALPPQPTAQVNAPAPGRPGPPDRPDTPAQHPAQGRHTAQGQPNVPGHHAAPGQAAAQADPVSPGEAAPPDRGGAGERTPQDGPSTPGQPGVPGQHTAPSGTGTQGQPPTQDQPGTSEQHVAPGPSAAQAQHTSHGGPAAPEQAGVQGQPAPQDEPDAQGQPAMPVQHTAQSGPGARGPSDAQREDSAPPQTEQAPHTEQAPPGEPAAPDQSEQARQHGLGTPEQHGAASRQTAQGGPGAQGQPPAQEQPGAREQPGAQEQHTTPAQAQDQPGAQGQHAVAGRGDAAAQDVADGPGDTGEWEELQAQHRGLQRDGSRPAFQPANEVERELLRAAANNDHDLFLQTMAGAEVLLPAPEDMDYTLRPGRAGFPWQTREVDGATVVPVFTSPERLIEASRSAAAGTEYIKVPFTVVLRYWPDQGWPLAINSGSPAGGTILAEQLPGLARWADQRAVQRMTDGFEPQNDVEQRLFEAAARRDTDTFFKVLLGAQVLVPAEPETPWGIAPGDPDFPWRPVAVHGEVCVQLFTSLKWMNEAIGSSRFVMPSLLEMVSAWPDLSWTLVLNPGTPIDATMPGEQVRALSGRPRDEVAEPPEPPAPAQQSPAQQSPAPEPPAPEAVAPDEAPPEPVRPVEPEFEPGNRIDQELYEATLGGDSDAFLRVLLNANVLVPIPRDAPLEVTPVQREFRWDAALQGETSVRVFTSLVRLREVLPESRFVYADFRELIAAWPREDWAMLLNPGTRIGASLRGDQVRALSEWAVRVGLVPARPEAPLPPSEPSPLVTVQDVVREEPPPVAAEEPPRVAVRDEPQNVRRETPAAEPYFEGDRVTQPTIMQKVVPHGHVGWYLDQGYDRVGGFVHPTSDVTELQTPVQLYEALGLLYEDTSFSPSDEGVYVIRWPAYCPDLYRVPFGGRDETELAAWGEAGWVIERPPFLGTGFAPGSAGSIREYKVDSVRLPYGAEMYYLGHDRSERFVAMYDPDRLAWLRPDAATGPEGWDGRTEAAQ